jgi:hypothetical protein
MPGMAEAIDGAMQQAPQRGRQSIGGCGRAAAMERIRLEALGNAGVAKVE